ncbi:hypothetical protein ACFRAU_05310 [Arthrobacter sp. NPDC056691]|uniref:hypothetical protein n=1 Tax=Arthrobacter sp. NPDC056691 TaxID=3345913 RepID=UPI00366DA42A
MEGSGNSALTAAPHGDALHAAAVPGDLRDAEFRFDALASTGFRDYGFPYDDDLDAAYPESFPEDPFPEALFAGRPFDKDPL